MAQRSLLESLPRDILSEIFSLVSNRDRLLRLGATNHTLASLAFALPWPSLDLSGKKGSGSLFKGSFTRSLSKPRDYDEEDRLFEIFAQRREEALSSELVDDLEGFVDFKLELPTFEASLETLRSHPFLRRLDRLTVTEIKAKEIMDIAFEALLELFPNLEALECESLAFQNNGPEAYPQFDPNRRYVFPKLKRLIIWDFAGINPLIISLPNIETLHVKFAPELFIRYMGTLGEAQVGHVFEVGPKLASLKTNLPINYLHCQFLKELTLIDSQEYGESLLETISRLSCTTLASLSLKFDRPSFSNLTLTRFSNSLRSLQLHSIKDYNSDLLSGLSLTDLDLVYTETQLVPPATLTSLSVKLLSPWRTSRTLDLWKWLQTCTRIESLLWIGPVPESLVSSLSALTDLKEFAFFPEEVPRGFVIDLLRVLPTSLRALELSRVVTDGNEANLVSFLPRFTLLRELHLNVKGSLWQFAVSSFAPKLPALQKLRIQTWTSVRFSIFEFKALVETLRACSVLRSFTLATSTKGLSFDEFDKIDQAAKALRERVPQLQEIILTQNYDSFMIYADSVLAEHSMSENLIRR